MQTGRYEVCQGSGSRITVPTGNDVVQSTADLGLGLGLSEVLGSLTSCPGWSGRTMMAGIVASTTTASCSPQSVADAIPAVWEPDPVAACHLPCLTATARGHAATRSPADQMFNFSTATQPEFFVLTGIRRSAPRSVATANGLDDRSAIHRQERGTLRAGGASSDWRRRTWLRRVPYYAAGWFDLSTSRWADVTEWRRDHD